MSFGRGLSTPGLSGGDCIRWSGAKRRRYPDGACFKPGEIWANEDGVLYRVIDVQVGARAYLRRGRALGKGKLIVRGWDEVVGWRLLQPLPESG